MRLPRPDPEAVALAAMVLLCTVAMPACALVYGRWHDANPKADHAAFWAEMPAALTMQPLAKYQ